LVAYGRTETAFKNIPALHNLVTNAKPSIHTLSASVPQLSKTPTHPPQLDTLSSSYFDPPVVHHRLVHTCKTKLYLALALHKKNALQPQTSLYCGDTTRPTDL
jgi:hypothetical protein